jgi:myosin-1
VGYWHHDVSAREVKSLWTIADSLRYTLAVGRAPFHAAKREDIYRKLKAREYVWPDLAKCSNAITDDLRDIVSLLLVHEDERPTPDQIVAHPFFKLGYIPLQLDSGCTSRVPKWPKIQPLTATTIKRGYTEEWWEMCKASAVGEYEPGKTFGQYGSRRNKTVARDCQKEIESGKQPNIPFAKDIVYLPFPARVQWPFHGVGGLSDITEEKESSAEGLALTETTGNDRPKGRLPRITRREEPMLTLKENNEPSSAVGVARRAIDKQPTRMRTVRKISNPGRMTAATAPAIVPLRVPKETRISQRTRPAKETVKEKQQEQPIPEIDSLHVSKSTSRTQKANPPAPKPVTPILRTLSSELPATDPVATLARLIAFRDNLTRALEKKTTISRRDKPPQLPFVSKWVDYSRKYGVGYVLDDGSIGCMMTATENFPVTVAFAANGCHHLKQLSKDPGYVKQVPIQLYAALEKSKGISRIEITDQRRQDDIRCYWQKFAKYMCMQLGEDDLRVKSMERPNFVKFYQRLGNLGIWAFDDGSFQVGTSFYFVAATSNIVQQFNFPDHTKLVLSSDAGYGKFLCLPAEGQEILRATNDVPFTYVRKRKTLYGSLQQLMYGSSVDKDDSYRELTESNELRAKIEFIHRIFQAWIEGGGLGCLSNPTDWEWTGTQLASDRKRHDWSSVGRFGGDVFF